MKAMHWFRRVSVRTRLGLLALVSGLAVATAAAVGLWASVRITTLGDRVIESKGMVADVLPPPLYLIEARLAVPQAFDGSMTPAQARRELGRLSAEHDARESYWRQHPVEGLPQELLTEQYDAAHRFMAAAADLIAGVNDTTELQTRSASLRSVHASYLAHRAAVDRTVQVAAALGDQAIQDLNGVISTSRVGLWATLMTATLVTVLLSWLSPTARHPWKTVRGGSTAPARRWFASWGRFAKSMPACCRSAMRAASRARASSRSARP